MSPEMGVLKRDFSVDDFQSIAMPCGVVGSIAVQARQTTEETCWLLDIADNSDFVRGVVGWAPLADSGITAWLDEWAHQPNLRGVRHVVHDEPDDEFLDRPDFNHGVAAALDRGLAYDLLIFAKHLPITTRFVDRHEGGRFVLDHIGKPEIRANKHDDWCVSLAELAERPNVYCKLSGVVTEADWKRWTPDLLTRYLDTTLEAFGAKRLMFGSDWPVCLLACEYKRWCEVVTEWAAKLSDDERDALYYGSCAEFYGIST